MPSTTPAPSQTQKALLVEKSLAPFTLSTIPKYTPGSGEILIKVKAVGLNPVDWKVRKEGLLNDIFTFPAVLGWDIAGDVEEVGEGVKDFQKGERVFGMGTFSVSEKSGYQQYTLALASTTAKIPSTISYDEAASIPVAITAAYVGLYNKHPYGLGLKPPVTQAARDEYSGKPFLVLGGSSSVGQYVIQLAKLSGFSPVITTASPKNAPALTALGADAVLSRELSTAALRAKISQLTSEPITLVYDSVSLDLTQRTAVDILAPGGRLVTTLPDAIGDDIDHGKTSVRVWGVLRLPQNVDLLENLFHDHLSEWVEKSLIKPNRIEVLPNGLSGILDGLERMEKDEVSRLKLIARPHETL